MIRSKMTQMDDDQFIAKLPGVVALMRRRCNAWEAVLFIQRGVLTRIEIEKQLMRAYPHLRWVDETLLRHASYDPALKECCT